MNYRKGATRQEERGGQDKFSPSKTWEGRGGGGSHAVGVGGGVTKSVELVIAHDTYVIAMLKGGAKDFHTYLEGGH